MRLTDEAGAKSFRHRRNLLIALFMALGVACVFRDYIFRNNFAIVEAGRVYRSAQPKSHLEQTLREFKIASVLNLRGGSNADAWYANEVRATRNIDFYDLPMSAERRPTRRELLLLLDLFGRCRYPLLIHCKSESDRTGMACGLYRMFCRGATPREALASLSIRHGHVPLWLTRHLHEPFVEYDDWLRAQRLAHTPARLLDWVKHEYRAEALTADVRPLRPGPRVQVAGSTAEASRR